MKDKTVIRETVFVVAGEVLLSAMMVGFFAVSGHYTVEALLGALAGCLATIANYLLMVATACLAAEKAARGQVVQAKKAMRLSSGIRLAILGISLSVCLKLGANPLALLLPLLFVRPILLLWEFVGKGIGYGGH